jgi:hypothetical protein
MCLFVKVAGFRDLGTDDDDEDMEMDGRGGKDDDDEESGDGGGLSDDDEEADSDDEFLESQLARIKKQLRREDLASDIEDDEEQGKNLVLADLMIFGF